MFLFLESPMKPYLEGSLPCHINTWKRPICFLIDSLDGEVKMMISFTGSYVTELAWGCLLIHPKARVCENHYWGTPYFEFYVNMSWWPLSNLTTSGLFYNKLIGFKMISILLLTVFEKVSINVVALQISINPEVSSWKTPKCPSNRSTSKI